jgi:hypothetical protein
LLELPALSVATWFRNLWRAATRSSARPGRRPRPACCAPGAEPVIIHALDPDSVADAVAKAEPDVIVHQLTALSGPMRMRNVKRMAAVTNRLRTEGTDHLLAAGRAVGVRRFVAQSNYALLERAGGPITDENGRIEPNPPKYVKEAMDALRHLEEAVTGITWGDGMVLPYGGFYGPGTGIEAAPGAVMGELIASGGSRSLAAVVGCGRWCTSPMPRRPRSRPSNAASRGSTTSPMTSRHRCATYCRSWPACSAPNRRAACRPGSPLGFRGSLQRS